MFRMFAVTTSLLTSTAMAQAAGGPPIAYVKIEGSGAAIYLASDNGSAPVKLYATASKRTIGHLDLRPGGNQVAFTEFGAGVPRTVKVLNFTDSGVRVGNPVSLAGICGVDTVDYHPTEPRLLISEACGAEFKIASINSDGTGYQALLTSPDYLNKARWLKDGQSFVYVAAPRDGGALRLCRDDCVSPLWTGSGLMWMDVARQSNGILFDSGGIYTHRLDADTGSLQTNFIVGTDGHYSPSDEDVLYETPHEARGDYLMIRRGNGSTFRLTTKGEYGSRDWRN
jgi:hypothetical protein